MPARDALIAIARRRARIASTVRDRARTLAIDREVKERRRVSRARRDSMRDRCMDD